MEEITLKKLNDSEIIDYYDKAVFQLPRELILPLTSMVVELFQRREEGGSNEQRRSFLSSFVLVDETKPTVEEIEKWIDDAVKKDCIEYVKEEEI